MAFQLIPLPGALGERKGEKDFFRTLNQSLRDRSFSVRVEQGMLGVWRRKETEKKHPGPVTSFLTKAPRL